MVDSGFFVLAEALAVKSTRGDSRGIASFNVEQGCLIAVDPNPR